MKYFSLFIFLVAQTTFAFDHSHTIFDKLLKTHVKYKGPQSLVNYKGFQKEKAKLDGYLKQLSEVSLKKYNSFNKDQKLAFLINAYNGFTIKLILNNYPLKSIKDAGSFFKSPWKKKFFKLLGEKMHLDGIEHGTIRKNFNEPRIHFAVNCASIGCPSLMPFAFIPKKIDQQLQFATESFLKNNQKNRYHAAEKKLEISKIFKWYGEDFEKTHGSVEAFVTTILKGDNKVKNPKELKVKYLDYDWGLNEWK